MESYDPLHGLNNQRFRLPGFDGAAFLLKPVMVPATELGVRRTKISFDVGLLSPDRKVEYLSRPAQPGFTKGLADFFRSAAQDFHPELSLPNFEDADMGLVVAAVSSSDLQVALQLTLVEEIGANVLEFDGLNFETSRLTLLSAANELSIFLDDWEPSTSRRDGK